MQYHLALIVFSIWYLTINAQSETTSTLHAVVRNVTIIETTTTTTTATSTTVHPGASQTTILLNMPASTIISNRELSPVYVEPPPHPLGYCIRSRLRCSKIRRCCGGSCDVNRMKCP